MNSGVGTLPPAVDAELVPLFDSWVLALPAQLARYALVPDIAAWAKGRLGDGDSAGKPERGAWTGRRGDRAPVRALLLKSAAGDPDTVRSYLASISDYALDRVRKQIVDGSAGLAASLPAETADFVRRAYLLAHDRRRSDGYSSVRDRSDVLGIGDDRDFYPASPLRPPFLQLLRTDADVGLALIRDLCNHAMDGWRRSWRQRGETPIPITIDLGEGDAEFWGDDGTYRWFRGGSHVHILDTAFLALDAWAHERLEAGDPLDELCRRIARGNECNAVLGICAGLVLANLGSAATSTVALAIGTHPALWTWDIGRQVLDMGSQANEMGYWGGAAFLAGALRTLNRLPHRQRTVRDLAPLLAGLCALLPASEIRTLVIARVDAAARRAGEEVMDMVVRSFLIDRMLRTEALDAGTLESWDLLTGWIVDRPVWAGEPVDAGQHERGLAVSSFFCAASGGMVCGVDSAWPNLNAVMPMLDRAAAAFGAEKTAFNAMLALMRARPDRLLPDPGLGWIGRVVRARRSSLDFWEYASNGEKVVLLLRELIAARALEQHHREIVVEVSDALIELGVKGAAFLQQDLVRHAR